MDHLSNFESLGDNCEFGFFLREMGNEEGSLFRWASIPDFGSLIRAIEKRFAGFYKLESLAPVYKDMVLDTSLNIRFHTDMYSTEVNGRWLFDRRASELQLIHRTEIQKMHYLREKFLKGVQAGGRFYVVKHNEGLPIETARGILKALRSIGDANVLLVRESTNAGTVEQIEQNLYAGYIDRFAPYNAADDISTEVWKSICRQVWEAYAGGEKVVPL